ncbi:FG-GAP repeat domain-containing protein [Larkinella punicea]|uniref:VCBS repeat-containing protein n=1 Tax=Larkinella punicea TaxID=2315727 RepID=A0A368JEC5_9BACT|nr:VCBS repeat-containing protein [Larkinella punicea]RCR66030.1 VCBS repeat-containing protein [Larkinella punicea]
MKSIAITTASFIRKGWLLSSCLALGVLTGHAQKGTELQFKKSVLTSDFIAEGATIGDVNKDGKKDVMAGAYWFEAPNWTPHELAKPEKFSYSTGYSNSFLNFALDVNKDGWVDMIRIDFPGKSAVWHENPKNQPGLWKVHPIHSSVGNESPLFVDVDGNGRADIICNDPTAKEIIWLRSPDNNFTDEWERFVISKGENTPGTHMYTHGLGFGDVNGDKKMDVVIHTGWWEGQTDPKRSNWTFHPAKLGEECAQMYITDVNGDGLNDVISSSAHKYGIWWHEQGKDTEGNPTWTTHEIHKTISQTHNLALVDMNGDKKPDLVTGKRYYAHNKTDNDPGREEPAVLYWFEFKPGKNPSWIPHEIDNNSGAGLHVVVEDMNGDRLPDIAVGNKKGVHVFEQLKKK